MQTDIYALTEFLPEGENVSKGYLQGRYRLVRFRSLEDAAWARIKNQPQVCSHQKAQPVVYLICEGSGSDPFFKRFRSEVQY